MAKTVNPSPAPEAEAPAGDPLFCEGGRFYVKDLEYRDAIYVDNDGREYPAKVAPLPTNKGTIGKMLPDLADRQKAWAAVSKLPKQQQYEAIAKLEREQSEPRECLFLNGNEYPLMKHNGILMYRGEREIDGKTVPTPTADLLVNFRQENKKADNWKSISAVRPAEYARTAEGQSKIPHFRLA